MIQTIIQSFHQTWSSASLDSDHTAAILLVTIIDVIKKAPAAQTQPRRRLTEADGGWRLGVTASFSWPLCFSHAQVETPPLCPYPSVRTGSPRRMLLSSKHSIYISPHKAGSAPSLMTPREKIHYYICSSPPNVSPHTSHCSRSQQLFYP